jgi:hypothetical protein
VVGGDTGMRVAAQLAKCSATLRQGVSQLHRRQMLSEICEQVLAGGASRGRRRRCRCGINILTGRLRRPDVWRQVSAETCEHVWAGCKSGGQRGCGFNMFGRLRRGGASLLPHAHRCRCRRRRSRAPSVGGLKHARACEEPTPKLSRPPGDVMEAPHRSTSHRHPAGWLRQGHRAPASTAHAIDNKSDSRNSMRYRKPNRTQLIQPRPHRVDGCVVSPELPDHLASGHVPQEDLWLIAASDASGFRVANDACEQY